MCNSSPADVEAGPFLEQGQDQAGVPPQARLERQTRLATPPLNLLLTKGVSGPYESYSALRPPFVLGPIDSALQPRVVSCSNDSALQLMVVS